MKTNPKGVGFWIALGGAATCTAFAYGPKAGIGAFAALALAMLVLG